MDARRYKEMGTTKRNGKRQLKESLKRWGYSFLRRGSKVVLGRVESAEQNESIHPVQQVLP